MNQAVTSTASQAWTINDNDQLQSGAQYAPIVIAYRNGAPVRLSDVATIVDSAEDTHKKAWVNETPALVLNIQRQPGTNIIGVVDTVTALLPQIRSSLPQGVQLQVITDRTTTIRASVRDVSLMLTIALVVMVIFMFLRSLSRIDHSRYRGAAFAGGHLRRHVRARVQPRQPIAHGPDDFDGFRGG